MRVVFSPKNKTRTARSGVEHTNHEATASAICYRKENKLTSVVLLPIMNFVIFSKQVCGLQLLSCYWGVIKNFVITLANIQSSCGRQVDPQTRIQLLQRYEEFRA